MTSEHSKPEREIKNGLGVKKVKPSVDEDKNAKNVKPESMFEVFDSFDLETFLNFIKPPNFNSGFKSNSKTKK